MSSRSRGEIQPPESGYVAPRWCEVETARVLDIVADGVVGASRHCVSSSIDRLQADAAADSWFGAGPLARAAVAYSRASAHSLLASPRGQRLVDAVVDALLTADELNGEEVTAVLRAATIEH
jgi:hypothetical protein